MQIKTITTVAGVNEIDFGNDNSQPTAHFYWLKNLGDSALYVSAKPDPIAEEDDVAELPAKGSVSVETDEGKVYILGAGKVEIHRTNSKFCPFELAVSGSGGGNVDYAKNADHATNATNAENADHATNAENADTLDGLHADGFIKANSSNAYDCNTLYDTGLYLCNGSAINTPNNLIYGTLFVMPYRKPYGNVSPDYCAQLFIPNGDADDPSLWYRTSLENSWSEWKRSCDGGNADTVDGLHASDFVRAFNNSDIANNRIFIPNDVHVGEWLHANAKIGMQYCRYTGQTGQTGLPEGANDWAWFTYDGNRYFAKTVSNRFFIMDYINSYTGWLEIYTSNSKPYVTGTVSTKYGEKANVSFGFTPSRVLYQPISPKNNMPGSIYVATNNVDANGFIPNQATYIQEDSCAFSYIAFK